MATLRALECLVALVDTGSVTKAAATLHMSQPALSHQIAALERELGTQVVERLARGVRVTAAGHATAAEARVALQAAERAVRVGHEVGAGFAGRLRIACAETMTVWLLVPVLRHWCSERPGVRLDLMEFTSADRMVDHLMAGEADLVIGPRPTSTSAHVEVLGQEEMVVVAPEDHPFAARPSVAVADLATEPFVHYDRDNGMAVWIDQFAARHQVTLAPVLRTRSPRTAAQLAGAGMGVTIVPASALIAAPYGVVRPMDPPVRRDVIAIMAAPADSLARRFVADLHARGLPATEI
ncbi:LysR family transcriptional regulator [Planotetraspora thailandica]|uniref:LysR family transcriptional regulator n=1 Tax=Planotetraspora thailandica TaxID=487172 RepID=A0A8J3UYR7_9ACTN|nr:LysR family transcriptional regulator [Planotetraspora thailandica]GII54328.1 LysR family transcriptional regulator [Planotetraspora thailandica]